MAYLSCGLCVAWLKAGWDIVEFGYGTGQKGTGRLLPDIIRDDSLGRKGGSGRFEGVWDTYRGI